MQHLFSSYHVGRIELKNRIVFPALASFLFDDEGLATHQTIKHYKNRAAGGPAMVIMEACAVSPEGIVSRNQARIYDEKHVVGLSKIAAVIKGEGAVPAVQLHHAGRQTSAKIIGQKPFAPSQLPCPNIQGDVTPLSINSIKKLIDKFGAAAEFAKKAGFELIEIHGAHGYLINQFLSGYSNIRKDQYGEGIEGRTKFAVEILQEIRRRLGNEFPLSFKISAQEFVPDGITIDESIEIIKYLVRNGLNLLQVSAGNDTTPEWICQPSFMSKACLADSSKMIKQALNIPVMVVGRINDPFTAEELISQGKTDLVCIGRGLIADPQLPNKAMNNKFEDIRPCIGCNTCMESIFRKGRLECLVNPSICKEDEMLFKPTDRSKKVIVVGGGPAGMNAAWIAAKRGHKVKLYEKSLNLGGMLKVGGMLCYKKELLDLIRYQKNQVKKFGVECHLGIQATVTTINSEKPDIVIMATGSTPTIPNIDGINMDHVVTAECYLRNGYSWKGNSAIIGGGQTGCEVALNIAELGGTVLIIEKSGKICRKLESVTRKVLLQKLEENSVTIYTNSKVIQITKNGLAINFNSNANRKIKADHIVIATGYQSNTDFINELKFFDLEIHSIGDCMKPRTAKSAINEGTITGLTL